MQIVIEIPDKKYEALKMLESATIGLHLGVVEKAIINGTPLPKGHGRLIDADALEARDISPEAWYSPMWGFEWVDIEDAPTIIEADKEVDE